MNAFALPTHIVIAVVRRLPPAQRETMIQSVMAKVRARVPQVDPAQLVWAEDHLRQKLDMPRGSFGG